MGTEAVFAGGRDEQNGGCDGGSMGVRVWMDG